MKKKTVKAVKTVETKVIKEVEKTVKDLLEQLQVAAEISVEESVSKEDAIDKAEKEIKQFTVNIKSDESGLLIGHHGETINSLQLLIGVILYKKLGEWVRVLLDVGDYRKMREETIKEMVNRIIAEVEQTGRPVELPYLSPLERRIVHMMLSTNEKIMSESYGEGKDRRVSIKPR